MRFHAIAATALLLLSSAAQAVTLRGGLTVSRFLVDPETSGEEMTFRPGVVLTLEQEMPLSFGGAFLFGAGFEQRGGGSLYESNDEDGEFRAETDIRLGYLIFPVGVKFENAAQAGARGYFALRAVPSILLSAHGKLKIESDFFSAEYEQDLMDEFNTFDLLGEVEGGLSIPMTGSPARLRLGASLGYGFLNVATEEEGEVDENGDPVDTDVSLNNLVFKVIVGYSF
ncbi:MAG: hypothetical protein K0Q91_2276 [Fibrobacteria bacterium]|jgi:hypothetical protein|nr:hypothetical protein [Fibrobacteria bacterium]